ncbi:MAG: DUF5666 domain-containing protein [Anaerolineae bacterium]|nr:DUF5666 domain-containing protein [Anaerolineae bacterium]
MVSKFIRPALVVVITLLLATLIGLPKIYAQSGDDVIQIELVGEIEALSTTTLTINGQVVDISVAELNTTLAVGEVVKVEGTLEADGSIVAREVKSVEEGELLPGEVEIIGLVEAFDTDSLTIGGLVIDITTAELEDALVLEVGAIVKVHLSLVTDAAGVESWVAREVQDGTYDNSQDDNSDNSNDDNSDDSPAGEFEMVGTLTSVDGDTIVVSGLTIDIASAEIKGILVEGALVKVHLSWVDGVLVAREVELHDSRPSDDDDSDDDGDDNSNDNSNTNSNVNTNANNSNDDDDSNSNNSNSNENENEDENENESNSNTNNSNDDDDDESNENTVNSNENNNGGGDDDQNQNDDNSGDSNNNDDHGGDDDNGDDD